MYVLIYESGLETLRVRCIYRTKYSRREQVKFVQNNL